jgi:hypothetical protein
MHRKTLVEDVPRRQPELRLEDEDDREREQEQPDEEADGTGGEAAADDGMRFYSPKGLKGFGLVETRTPFVSV